MSIDAFDRRGMTLVELLVAGVISVILGGVILVIYRMYDTQVRESTARLALQMQYAVVVEQIAAYAHSAHKILEQNVSTVPEQCLATEATTQTLYFYTATGLPFAGIEIAADSVSEYTLVDDTLKSRSFNTSSGPVQVDPASCFKLNGCRNAVTLYLRLKKPHKDTVYYVGPANEVFLCRN